MDLHPIEIAGLLLAAGVLGALLPLYRRWSERGLHLFVALAAGVFLGTIFLDLLPHMAGVEEHGHGHGGHVDHAATGVWPWVAALAGLLLLFAIEKVWLPTLAGDRSGNPHAVLWWATLVGLSLHALTAGVSLSAVLSEPGGRAQLLASLLIHKATETFSLATVMRLAGLSRARMIGWLTVFVVLEPGAFLLGRGLVDGMPSIDSLLVGFACGTFLYVALCDLLPEVFHGHDRPRLKLVAVLVGIAITAVSMPFLASATDFAKRTLVASLDVFLDLAPYLLIGLFVAGLVHLVLKRVRLARKMAGNDLKSVLWATFLGAPLPLCSCSVVPVAVTLRRGGASKGATSAFAISTPETGVDSLTVSYVLLDPLLATARLVGALVSATVSGVAVNAFVRAGLDRDTEPRAPDEPTQKCAHDEAPGHVHAHGHHHGHVPAHSHGTVATKTVERKVRPKLEPIGNVALKAHEHDPVKAPSDGAANVAPREGSWFTRATRYAFVEMLDDLALSLIVGVLLSGAIMAALPKDVFTSPLASGFPALLAMLVVGIPLYVCALTSTPIAAALMSAGLSPGAAFVFLLAGPATNAAAILMLSKVLGKRVVIVQLIALSVTVVAMGWFVDRLYSMLDRPAVAEVGELVEHVPGWIAIVSAVVLGALILASLYRTYGSRPVLPELQETA
ncbi:MAG: SO_0444 family Cu/Zn efflux transporter [Planctomycetota bacterium]|nr:SO_0444 family Cu/Zn efflux transporter [Planctomycetota bacterium]